LSPPYAASSDEPGTSLAAVRSGFAKEKLMADIVKKNGGQVTESNPMRLMREMLRWDPFREMAPLLPFASFERVEWNPSFDVSENKDSYQFRADVPGVKREDLEITTAGNRIQVSGKRESEQETKDDTFYTYERQWGSFSRSFTLPDGADVEHAKSELKDGVLTLVIPKKAGAQAKKIPIAAPGAKS
jgi:HSP20 family protein